MNLHKTTSFSLLFVAVCVFSSVIAIHAEPLPQFTIMTEDWEPYNFSKDDNTKGISTDILVLMLERLGSTQGRKDIKILPWARAYKTIQEIPNTILFTTTRTAERENLFKWVGPIFELEFNLYALKSKNIKINSFEDVRKYKIGTLRGDVVEDLLVKNAGMQLSDFDQVGTNIQNTKKLSIGRIDLAAQTKDTTINTCKEAGLNPDDFEPVFVLDKKSMYYAFHKETSDAVIAAFQKAFDDLVKEGKVSEIFRGYGK